MTSYLDPLDAIRAAKEKQAESFHRGLTSTGAGQLATTAHLRELAGIREGGAAAEPTEPGMNDVLRAYQRNDFTAAERAAYLADLDRKVAAARAEPPTFMHPTGRTRPLYRPTTGDVKRT